MKKNVDSDSWFVHKYQHYDEHDLSYLLLPLPRVSEGDGMRPRVGDKVSG